MTEGIFVVLAVLVGCGLVYFSRHPNARRWDREHSQLLANGASPAEAIAGATDAVLSRAYTEHFRGKTVRSIERDPEAGRWTVIFEDGASLPVVLSGEDGSSYQERQDGSAKPGDRCPVR